MDIFGNFSNLKGDKKKRRVALADEGDFKYEDMTLEAQAKLEDKNESHPVPYQKVIIVLVFLLLLAKLFTLQIIGAAKNKSLAEGNRERPRSVLSSRGIIFDANGVWLARNKPSFALGVYPSDIPKKSAERNDFYQKLAKISGVTKEEIQKKIENAGFTSIELVVIKADLSREEALVMEEEIFGMPGAIIDSRSIREYKNEAGLSHILGYTGLISQSELELNSDYLISEDFGKSGLEKTYEDELRGTPGIEKVEVDSHGKIIRTLTGDENRLPVAGDNLVLNIDLKLQNIMATALQNGISAAGNGVNSGVVVALNPQTGAVLGLVSLPAYDNNIFEGKINNTEYQKLLSDPSLPLLNRATNGVYPSGSVIKIVMAAAGLQEGIISKNTSIETPPTITIGTWNFPDWKWHTGITNVVRAIAESNNIFFYSLAGGWDKIKGLGVEKLDQYLSMFGFGSKTGIDLPSEASGLVPNPEWKEKYKKENWYIGDTYHLGIGQGDLLITPLQMAKALSTIANGGKLLTPQIVKDVTDSDGKIVKSFAPKVEKENFISSENIQTVQEGMRQTVISGSGKTMQDLPISVAAKTGTAQFLNNQKTHAWFECYAPYENPQIALVVLVEGGGGGYEIAEPVAHEILQAYYAK